MGTLVHRPVLHYVPLLHPHRHVLLDNADDLKVRSRGFSNAYVRRLCVSHTELLEVSNSSVSRAMNYNHQAKKFEKNISTYGVVIHELHLQGGDRELWCTWRKSFVRFGGRSELRRFICKGTVSIAHEHDKADKARF